MNENSCFYLNLQKTVLLFIVSVVYSISKVFLTSGEGLRTLGDRLNGVNIKLQNVKDKFKRNIYNKGSYKILENFTFS